LTHHSQGRDLGLPPSYFGRSSPFPVSPKHPCSQPRLWLEENSPRGLMMRSPFLFSSRCRSPSGDFPHRKILSSRTALTIGINCFAGPADFPFLLVILSLFQKQVKTGPWAKRTRPSFEWDSPFPMFSQHWFSFFVFFLARPFFHGQGLPNFLPRPHQPYTSPLFNSPFAFLSHFLVNWMFIPFSFFSRHFFCLCFFS